MRILPCWPLAPLPPAFFPSRSRLVAGLLLLSSAAVAQVPVITGLSPARNLPNAPRTTSVAVNFDQPMDPAPATADAVKVFSQQRGGLLNTAGGAATGSGNTLTFDPTTDFRPGETVLTTVTTAAQSTGGVPLADGYVYQFTAAATGGSGNFTAPALNPNPAVGIQPFSVAVGDVDGDGDLDLLAANSTDNTVSVRINDGTGSFSGGSNPTVGSTPYSVALGDVDGDGDLDLLTANYDANTVSVRRNDGNGTFSGGGTVSVGTNPFSMAVGDIDGDADLDLLAVNQGANTVSVRFNNGSGSFSGGSTVGVGSTPYRVVVGDVDADGDLDLLTANFDANTVSVRLNDGSGTFSGGTNPAVGSSPLSLAIGDVDGDGDLDLLTANAGDGTVSVRRNDGTGTFSGGSNPAVGAFPYDVAVGDVDGDGDLDLLAANSAGLATVSVRLNNGTGSFTAPATNPDPPVGLGVRNVVLGDLDGDGDLDLLTANYDGGTVSVRLNQGGQAGPTLSSLSPTSGPVGTVVTLTGTGLTGATAVTFNGTAATTFSVTNATTATATVPVGATSGPVTITTPGGTSNGVSFTVLADLIVSTQQNISGDFNSVTVQAGGEATLTGPLTVAAAFTVQPDGQLFTNCQPLTGPGSFMLEAGGTLAICDPAGITLTGPTGAVQVTGARSFASDATYVYDGTAAQTTGTGLPATVRELETANNNGVSLSQATAVTHALRLTSGTLTTGGQLTLLSTATRTAYAVHNGGLTSGSVTVQRYVGGPTDAGYRHLSSPVQSTTVADLTTAGFTPRVDGAYNALPMTTPYTAANFPNVFGFDEARGGTNPAFADFLTGYFSPATLGTNLISGRGYTVFMPGAQTPDFVGALTTGNVPVNLTVTGINTSPNQQKAGWHLLGNLYPQPIDWDLATVPTGMSASISVFRTQGGNNGQYLTRANGMGSLLNGELPLGQAFFARATTNNTVFTFTNALRVEANPGTVARPVADARPTVRLTLTSTAPDAVADETLIYAEAGATPGEDNRFDGLRPGRNTGAVPTLATIIDGQEAAVNGLPLESLTTGTTTVELTAALPTAGTYTLTAADVANLPAGTTVSLLDRKLNITQPLTAGTAYQLTAATAGEVLAGRFALVFNANRVTGTHSSFLIPHSSLTIAPNPVATGGALRVTGSVVGTRLTLFDATGRAVAHATADAAGATSLPLRGLATGVYTLRTPDGRTARLVVE